jgi:PAS domain S-box-containing protein
VFVADLTGRYTEVNTAACSMLGYSRDEIVGKTIVDLIPPEDVERLSRSKQLLLGGDVAIDEWTLRRKDGTYLPVEVSAKILPDGRWQAFVRDITERKRLSEELRRSEARASGIVSVSADAIISVDETQCITRFNGAAEKIFGYSQAEACGAPLDLLIPERLRAAHRRHVDGFVGGHSVARRMGERGTPILGLRKNGEEFPADAAISKLTVDGQTILTVALRDVSEQQRVEDEILQGRERFDLALQGADLAAWDWNVVTGDVIFNPRWAEMRGFRPDEVAPRVDSWIAGVHPDDLARVQEALQRHFDGLTREYVNEHRCRTKSGQWIWILDRGRVFARDAEGRPIRMVGTELDITERKRLEEERQHAIRARDDLLGVVAHDLRNPLGTILIQAALLRRRDDAANQNPAQLIERSAHRMNRLIEDLLDVTRIEAGMLSLDRAWVSARSVVGDSAEALRSLASSASLELRLDAAEDLPDVFADRDELSRVFENLVGNAVKFTERGGSVTIGAASRDGEILFWVADTGIGIAGENLPHVFDRFWQAKKAERRGAGLGLPIVKGIVEAHGGRVWVESWPGRGSTFYFTMPAAPRVEAWRAEPAPQRH